MFYLKRHKVPDASSPLLPLSVQNIHFIPSEKKRYFEVYTSDLSKRYVDDYTFYKSVSRMTQPIAECGYDEFIALNRHKTKWLDIFLLFINIRTSVVSKSNFAECWINNIELPNIYRMINLLNVVRTNLKTLRLMFLD